MRDAQKTQLNLVALAFARAAGVEPHLNCFRLEGPDALADAPARFAREAAAFGAVTSNELTERERRYWSLVDSAVR